MLANKKLDNALGYKRTLLVDEIYQPIKEELKQ